MMSASQEPGVDLYVQCKRKGMAEAVKQLRDKTQQLNLISVGDSYVEAEAAVDLVWCRDEGHHHRVIKLQDEPGTIEDLTQQVLQLQTVLPAVCCYEGDLRMELADASEVLDLDS